MDERTPDQVQKEAEENIRQQQELSEKERDGSITSDERALLDHLDDELRQLAREANRLGSNEDNVVEAARRRTDRETGVTKVEEIQGLDDDTAH